MGGRDEERRGEKGGGDSEVLQDNVGGPYAYYRIS